MPAPFLELPPSTVAPALGPNAAVGAGAELFIDAYTIAGDLDMLLRSTEGENRHVAPALEK